MAKSSSCADDFEFADVGKRIQESRKKQGLTREQLSEKSGLAVQSLVKIESGSRNFRISSLKAISQALGLSSDYLLGLSEYNESDNILTLCSLLDPNGKNFIKHTILSYLEVNPRK